MSRTTVISIAVLLINVVTHAQVQPQALNESEIILSAMRDEQQRSLQELKLEGHSQAFYISYELNDLNTQYFTATSGALNQTHSQPVRNKNVRVLVGDYEFNDESLDNDIYTEGQPNEIALPLENDYLGIRRAFWVTTDAVYQSAAKHFKENQNTLKDKGKALKELPHRTFAKVPSQTINKFKKFEPIDSKFCEDYVRKASAFFNSNNHIFSVTVSLSITQGHRYYLNTEGTSSVTPVSIVNLSVNAAQDHTWQTHKELELSYPSIDKLPTLVALQNELLAFAQLVSQKKDSLRIKEEYAGPVLYIDRAVSELFSNVLVGRESLHASNTLEEENQYQENNNQLDKKIGKALVTEAMTVKAKPKLKSFNGVALTGSYDMDSEGVIPADELVLIEKGILKNLLNDRSLTKPDQTANGHADGPGVIEVSFDGNQTTQSLKALLIEKAKEEDLEYAFLVKRLFKRNTGENEIYRINVKTGVEEKITGAVITPPQLKQFKKAKAASGPLRAYNLWQNADNGLSIICPESLLLENVEIAPNRQQENSSTKETVFVEAPKKPSNR